MAPTITREVIDRDRALFIAGMRGWVVLAEAATPEAAAELDRLRGLFELAAAGDDAAANDAIAALNSLGYVDSRATAELVAVAEGDDDDAAEAAADALAALGVPDPRGGT